MPNENSVSRKAVKFVFDYEKKQKRDVVDVQANGKFRGFDLFSFSKDKKDIRTIEVKGTEKGGIPDCFETEFSKNKKLIATHLYLVHFKKTGQPDLYIFPASIFLPEHISETVHYRINPGYVKKIMPKHKISVK